MKNIHGNNTEFNEPQSSGSEDSEDPKLRLARLTLGEVEPDTSLADLPHGLNAVYAKMHDLTPNVAGLFLNGDVKSRFNLTSDNLKYIRQSWQSYRAQEQEAREAQMKEATRTIAVKHDPAARQLLSDPALLHNVAKVLEESGLEGERKNALMIYLILTSRKLATPMSAVIKGESSGGKSYLLTTVLQLFGEEAYINLTDVTAQALYYDDEDYAHRIIVLFEKHGSDKANYAIRTLQSEHKLVIKSTQKDENGRLRTMTITKDGPTGFITTTTESRIHPENETRNFSLYVDESSKQTERIKAASARKAEGKRCAPTDRFEIFCRAQDLLDPVEVRIPYATYLAKRTPATPLRIRRDFSRLLGLIETSAFLHQNQREKSKEGDTTIVKASLADYANAISIGREVLTRSLNETSEKTQEFVKIAQEIYDEKNRNGGTELLVTYDKIARRAEVTAHTVQNWLKPAIRDGSIEVIRGRGPNPDFLRPTKPAGALQDLFPSIEDMCKEFPDLAKNLEWVDPITGDIRRPM